MLDHGSPERPGIRNDDPDLHPQELCMARYLSALCWSVDRPEEPNERIDARHPRPTPSCAAHARRRRPGGLRRQQQGHGDAKDASGHDDGERRDAAPSDRWWQQGLAEGHALDGEAQPPSAPAEKDQPLRPDTGRGQIPQGRRARRPAVVLGRAEQYAAATRHDAAEGREPPKITVGQKVDFIGLLTDLATDAGALGVRKAADTTLLEQQGAYVDASAADVKLR
jgi:hypothetical protein